MEGPPPPLNGRRAPGGVGDFEGLWKQSHKGIDYERHARKVAMTKDQEDADALSTMKLLLDNYAAAASPTKTPQSSKQALDYPHSHIQDSSLMKFGHKEDETYPLPQSGGMDRNQWGNQQTTANGWYGFEREVMASGVFREEHKHQSDFDRCASETSLMYASNPKGNSISSVQPPPPPSHSKQPATNEISPLRQSNTSYRKTTQRRDLLHATPASSIPASSKKRTSSDEMDEEPTFASRRRLSSEDEEEEEEEDHEQDCGRAHNVNDHSGYRSSYIESLLPASEDDEFRNNPLRRQPDSTGKLKENFSRYTHRATQSPNQISSTGLGQSSTRSDNPCCFSTRKSLFARSPQRVPESQTWSSKSKTSLWADSLPGEEQSNTDKSSSVAPKMHLTASHNSSAVNTAQSAAHVVTDMLDIDINDDGGVRSSHSFLHGSEDHRLPQRKRYVKKKGPADVRQSAEVSPQETGRQKESDIQKRALSCRPKLQSSKSAQKTKDKSHKPRKSKARESTNDALAGSFRHENDVETFNRRVASLALQMIPQQQVESKSRKGSVDKKSGGSSRSSLKKSAKKGSKSNAFPFDNAQGKPKNMGRKLRQRGRCFVQASKPSKQEGRVPMPPEKAKSNKRVSGVSYKSQQRKMDRTESEKVKTPFTSSKKKKKPSVSPESEQQTQDAAVSADQKSSSGAKTRVNFKDETAEHEEATITPEATPTPSNKKRGGSSFHSSIMGAKERTPYNPTGMTPYTPAAQVTGEPNSAVKFSKGVPLSEAKKRLQMDDLLSPCFRASRCEALFEGESDDANNSKASYESLSISGDSSSRDSRGKSFASRSDAEDGSEHEDMENQPPAPHKRPSMLAGVFAKLQMEDLEVGEQNFLSTIEEDEVDLNSLTQSQLQDSFVRAQLSLPSPRSSNRVVDVDQVNVPEPKRESPNTDDDCKTFEELQMQDIPLEDMDEIDTSSPRRDGREQEYAAGPMTTSQHHIFASKLLELLVQVRTQDISLKYSHFAVHNHARHNRRDKLREILDRDEIDVDTPDEDGMTLLLVCNFSCL